MIEIIVVLIDLVAVILIKEVWLIIGRDYLNDIWGIILSFVIAVGAFLQTLWVAGLLV